MISFFAAVGFVCVAAGLNPAPFEAAYPNEYAVMYGVEDGLPGAAVSDVAVLDNGTVVAVTDGGMAVFVEEVWWAPELRLEFEPTVCAAGEGDLFLIGGGNSFSSISVDVVWDRVWAADIGEGGDYVPELCGTGVSDSTWIGGDQRLLFAYALAGVQLGDDSVTELAVAGDISFAGTDRGVWRIAKGKARKIWDSAGPVTALCVQGERLLVGTEEALVSMDFKGRHVERVLVSDARGSWAPAGVGALAAVGRELWVGDVNGAARYDGGAWSLYTGAEGLPYDHFTDAAAATPGVVWLGTERGAIRFDSRLPDDVRVRPVGFDEGAQGAVSAFDATDGCWFYREGMRWLPYDRVNAIAVAPNGDAWIATPRGLSRIVIRPQTLEEKAAEFERIVDTRHRRLDDFVLRCYFEEPGNLETSYQRATDNDGLYTAMYGASQCFRYGATHEARAKENAQRAFRGLKRLYDVTGIPGFPARAIHAIAEGNDPNERFGEAQNLAMQKEDPLWKNIVPRWPISVDGKYWWKCDTSSDEVCGHYFFFAVYHDLVCETEAERREVVDVVHALTEHIVDHGFTLTDHDGKPTRWANWSPAYVNGINGWADRGIQSVEILSFLNVGLKLTGDPKFAKAAAYLRDEHDYHLNAIRSRSFWPPSSIVPWDNNLAFLSFYGLIEYEEDPALKSMYRLALDNAWSFSARQNDPFFNLTYLSLYPEDEAGTIPEERELALAHAIETLARTPQLLIAWKTENSQRLDVYVDPTPRRGKAYGWMLNGNAVPIDERAHMRINSDHFDLDSKAAGDCEYEGTFFLLPYYMGRYYELIGS